MIAAGREPPPVFADDGAPEHRVETIMLETELQDFLDTKIRFCGKFYHVAAFSDRKKAAAPFRAIYFRVPFDPSSCGAIAVDPSFCG